LLAVKGAWAQARAAFEAVIRDFTRAVGAEHPWTRAAVEELQQCQPSHQPMAEEGVPRLGRTRHT
jgi:hypothetical protein